MAGRKMQPASAGDGSAHAVGVPPAGPVSITLQSVVVGVMGVVNGRSSLLNAQLCPPPVSGWVGSLCSETELSGTKIEPAGRTTKRLTEDEAAGRKCRAVRANRPGEILANESKCGRSRKDLPYTLPAIAHQVFP